MTELPRSNTRASSASILIGGILCLGLLAGGCAMGNKDDQDSQARINEVLAELGLPPLEHHVDPTTERNITIQILRANLKNQEAWNELNHEIAEANRRMGEMWLDHFSHPSGWPDPPYPYWRN